MKTLLVLIALFTTSFTFAGNGEGNGEKGVQAPDGKVSVLDLIRQPGTAYLDAPETVQGKDFIASLKGSNLLKELTYFPMRGRSFAESAPKSFGEMIENDFRSLKFYLSPGPLTFTNDVDHIVFKKQISGKLVQIAVQDKDGRVAVDRDLYPLMSKKDVIEMFRHETFIRSFAKDTLRLPWKTDSIMDLVHLLSGSDPLVPLTARAVAFQACMANLPVKWNFNQNVVRSENLFNPNVGLKINTKHFLVVNDTNYCDTDGVPVVSFQPLESHYNLIQWSPDGKSCGWFRYTVPFSSDAGPGKIRLQGYSCPPQIHEKTAVVLFLLDGEIEGPPRSIYPRSSVVRWTAFRTP